MDNNILNGAGWAPFLFGRTIHFTRPGPPEFLAANVQFRRLQKSVPQSTLVVDDPLIVQVLEEAEGMGQEFLLIVQGLKMSPGRNKIDRPKVPVCNTEMGMERPIIGRD